MRELVRDKERSEGNGGPLHSLVRTGRARGGDPIDEKRPKHGNGLGGQFQGDLRVHDVHQEARSAKLVEGSTSRGLRGVLIVEVQTYIIPLLSRNGGAIIGGGRKGVALPYNDVSSPSARMV